LGEGKANVKKTMVRGVILSGVKYLERVPVVLSISDKEFVTAKPLAAGKNCVTILRKI